MSDTIYRQAVINAIENTDCELSSDAWDELTNAIMSLPSAQPDADAIHLQKEQAYMQGWEDGKASIIRCKECEHRPKATRADEKVFHGFSVEFPDEKCPCHCEDGWYGWYPDDNFYCGYAERRTDETD